MRDLSEEFNRLFDILMRTDKQLDLFKVEALAAREFIESDGDEIAFVEWKKAVENTKKGISE